MIKMKNYNRKSVFVTLLISFIIILLFPITVEILLYNKMESIIKDNANRSNVAMLRQASDAIDNEIYRVNHLSAQISFNPRLHFILSQKNENEKFINYYNFMKDIKNYNISNSFIYDYYIYFPKEDVIITPAIKTNSNFFYQHYYNYENMNYEDWKDKMLQTNSMNTYIPSTTVYEGISKSPLRMITFLQPLPYQEIKNPKAYLAILINERKIKSILQNLEWANQGDIYILDQQDNKIMTTANDEQLFKNIDLNLEDQNGVFEVKVNNEKMIVSYVISKQSNWKYISIVPKSTVMAKVKTVKGLALSSLIFCLVGGFIASYYLAYRHYVPVKELVGSIVKRVNRNGQFQFNEYHIIKETLNKSWEEGLELRNKLTEHAPQIKANFLTRLINGFVDESTITMESLSFMNLSFSNDHYIVLVIDAEERGHLIYEDSEKQWAIIRFIIGNISEELMNEDHHGYIVELDQRRVGVILNVEEKRPKSIEHLAYRLKEIMNDRFDVVISIGIGQVHTGMRNIVTTYREALQALNYRMIKGNGKIIHYRDTKEAEDHYYYPEGIESQLMNVIKIADFENAEKILEAIYEENFKSRNISFQIGKCLFFNIMNTHLKILNDINIKYDSIFSSEENPVKLLLECETAEEMHNKIKSIYKRLCDYINENRNNQSDRLISATMNFIQNNYSNNMLSLTLIAEEMKITPQYLSSVFKKQTGENITDYIAKLRLERAKELLIKEELTILEIAKQIGYSNDVGLIRLFKKYEKITPGSYRASFKDGKVSNE